MGTAQSSLQVASQPKDYKKGSKNDDEEDMMNDAAKMDVETKDNVCNQVTQAREAKKIGSGIFPSKNEVQVPYRRRGRVKQTFAQRSLLVLDQKTMMIKDPKQIEAIQAASRLNRPQLARSGPESQDEHGKHSSDAGAGGAARLTMAKKANQLSRIRASDLVSLSSSKQKTIMTGGTGIDENRGGGKSSNNNRKSPSSVTAAVQLSQTLSDGEGVADDQATTTTATKRTAKKDSGKARSARRSSPTTEASSIASTASKRAPKKKANTATTVADLQKSFWLPQWSQPRSRDQEGPDIKRPHPHDVLLGRGSGIAQHPGNLIFRTFCWGLRKNYHQAHPTEKSEVAFKVLEQVASLDPPGRFLAYHGTTLRVVSKAKAVEKVRQALREKKWDVPTPTLFASEAVRTALLKKDLKSATKLKAALSEDVSISSGRKKKASQKDGVASVASVPEKSVPEKSAPEKSAPKKSVPEKSVPENVPAASTEDVAEMPSEEDVESVEIGSSIKVFWPLDNAFYPAKVRDRLGNLFYLEYYDGVEEWLDLTTNRFVKCAPEEVAAEKPTNKEAGLV